jgi:hypothetical protein
MNTKSSSTCMSVARFCVHPFLLALATAMASATTVSVGGGTLTYTVTSVEYECQIGPPVKGQAAPPYSNEEPYWISTFSDFSFTLSGTTTPLPGELQQTTGPGTNPEGCPSKEYPSATWYIPPVFPFTTQNVITFATSEYEVGEGTASAATATPGILYPKYQVQSIIYAAPGNLSSNGFTNAETDGMTTSVGSSFAAGDTTTYSVSTGFLGFGSTISWSFGNSTTTGNSTGVTETITDATGVANASNASSPNSINHQQDLFVIWINPAVVVYQTGATSVGYAQGTQLQTTGDPNPGQPEAYQDQIEVFAQAMMANAEGVTTVPASALAPVVIDGETLPGLAAICANQAYYPNKCFGGSKQAVWVRSQRLHSHSCSGSTPELHFNRKSSERRHIRRHSLRGSNRL